jgi:hypothetical protein
MNWTNKLTFKKFLEQLDLEKRLNPTANALNIARGNIEIALRTKKGNVKTTVTVIEFFEDDLPLEVYCPEPKRVTGETLKDAAKAVYDFCKKEGLKPGVVYKHSSDQNHFIRITAELPVGKRVKKVKFPKKKVKFRAKAKPGSH